MITTDASDTWKLNKRKRTTEQKKENYWEEKKDKDAVMECGTVDSSDM